MRKPLSLKSLIILIAVLIVVAGVAGWAYFRSTRPTLALSGEVQAREIRNGSRFGGRVRRVFVREGQIVQAGQPLVEFEDTDLKAKIADARATLNQAIARERLLARGADLGEVRQAGAAVRQSQEQLKMLRTGARPEELAQAQSRLRAAEAQWQQAQKMADNAQTMLDAGIISRQKADALNSEVEAARSNVDSLRAALALAKSGGRAEERRIAQANASAAAARYQEILKGAPPEEMSIASANVEKARSALQSLEAQTGEVRLKAPFAGYVSVVGVTEGELVPPGRPVVSIIDYSHLWTDVYVPESRLLDLGLAPGEPVSVETEAKAASRHTFPGRIALINPRSEFVPNSGGDSSSEESAFRVKIELSGTNADGRQRLYPGMKVKVRFRQ
jgi:HlyD family secretion protein